MSEGLTHICNVHNMQFGIDLSLHTCQMADFRESACLKTLCLYAENLPTPRNNNETIKISAVDNTFNLTQNSLKNLL